MKYSKIAFIFPGQGAQYPGMGKDFAAKYQTARYTYEEADDCLKRNLSSIVWNGPEDQLIETRNSQTGIFVTSMALLRVLNELFPAIKPYVVSGFSLGEYSALAASEKIGFVDCLNLVDKRSQYMNDACEETKGAMSAVMGLNAEEVESLVSELKMPNDLWVANFNCPGQVVISGTVKGIEIGSEKLKERGAKRVLPLKVHGAFHSGLMSLAEEKLKPEILHAPFKESPIGVVMNYSGGFVKTLDELRRQLIKQVTSSVRWEQGIRSIGSEGIDLFVEIGCGRTLSGMNKRIGVTAPSLNIEKIEDLETFSKEIEK